MDKVIADVADFHTVFDVPMNITPQFPGDDRIKLRRDCVLEECIELDTAIDERNLPEVADAIADLIYFLVSMALEFGIPLADVWDEVHYANMAKRDPVTGAVRFREDGKVLKPDGWTPPDIAGIIERAK